MLARLTLATNSAVTSHSNEALHGAPLGARHAPLDMPIGIVKVLLVFGTCPAGICHAFGRKRLQATASSVIAGSRRHKRRPALHKYVHSGMLLVGGHGIR
jgi:hypothetical protein